MILAAGLDDIAPQLTEVAGDIASLGVAALAIALAYVGIGMVKKAAYVCGDGGYGPNPDNHWQHTGDAPPEDEFAYRSDGSVDYLGYHCVSDEDRIAAEQLAKEAHDEEAQFR